MTDDEEKLLFIAVRHNSEELQRLVEETQGLRETWEAMDGAIKVFNALGRFIKWAAGFGALLYSGKSLLDHFGK